MNRKHFFSLWFSLISTALVIACTPPNTDATTSAMEQQAPTPPPYPYILTTSTPGPYPALLPVETTALAAYYKTQTAQPTLTPTATPCALLESINDYRGCFIPPLPKGVNVSGPGWLMSDYQTNEFTFVFEVVSQDNLRMLWLSKATGHYRVPNGESIREILAILVLPTLTENETFANHCRYHDAEIDPEIFAVASTLQNTNLEHDTITQAWRANRQSLAFEPIATDGVICSISPMEYWR